MSPIEEESESLESSLDNLINSFHSKSSSNCSSTTIASSDSQDFAARDFGIEDILEKEFKNDEACCKRYDKFERTQSLPNNCFHSNDAAKKSSRKLRYGKSSSDDNIRKISGLFFEEYVAVVFVQ